MQTNARRGQESPATDDSTDPEPRDVRALTEYLTALEDVGCVAGADDLYLVVSESGSEYIVDARLGACECPDAQHRDPEGGCKHVRRALFASGRRPIPEDVDADAIDDQLGEHVDNVRGAVATDGGTVTADEEDDDDPCECDTYESDIECARCAIADGDRLFWERDD